MRSTTWLPEPRQGVLRDAPSTNRGSPPSGSCDCSMPCASWGSRRRLPGGQAPRCSAGAGDTQTEKTPFHPAPRRRRLQGVPTGWRSTTVRATGCTLERHPVQPRVAPPAAGSCHPQDHDRLAANKHGKAKELRLGNSRPSATGGFARGLRSRPCALMLPTGAARHYVVATGRNHSVRSSWEEAFPTWASGGRTTWRSTPSTSAPPRWTCCWATPAARRVWLAAQGQLRELVRLMVDADMAGWGGTDHSRSVPTPACSRQAAQGVARERATGEWNNTGRGRRSGRRLGGVIPIPCRASMRLYARAMLLEALPDRTIPVLGHTRRAL